MLERLQIGIVTKPRGLRGEVSIFPTTDDVGRFSELESVLTADSDQAPELTVEGVKYFKNRPILKFAGIDSVEEAEKLRGTALFVRREDAIPLEEGEYYIGDLVGCEIYLEDGSHFGVLKDILTGGAQNVYVIGGPEGKDVLIPAVEEFVRDKDVENRRITVRILKEV